MEGSWELQESARGRVGLDVGNHVIQSKQRVRIELI